MEIVAIKRANMDTHILLTTKITPIKKINDHRIAAHFTAMTKPYETLFYEKKLAGIRTPPSDRSRKPNHQMEPGNHKRTTKGWNIKTIQLLEGYFDIPENMTCTLLDDLENAKQVDLVTPASRL
jgi:hypothetical protein